MFVLRAPQNISAEWQEMCRITFVESPLTMNLRTVVSLGPHPPGSLASIHGTMLIAREERTSLLELGDPAGTKDTVSAFDMSSVLRGHLPLPVVRATARHWCRGVMRERR